MHVCNLLAALVDLMRTEWQSINILNKEVLNMVYGTQVSFFITPRVIFQSGHSILL